MATTADFGLEHTPKDSNVPRTDSPPGYYTVSEHVHTGTTPPFIGMHGTQPSTMGTSVVMIQPVMTGPEPRTTCSLVMSVLSTIFCCFICGMAGILVAWKARLYVLEKKYEQARHSVKVVWIFFGLAVFFGVIFIFSCFTPIWYVVFGIR
ncbi:uncharacterized protein LOC112577226 [Pomacea canaliculata]|uniref:uncharacterized protein LOC112577226 n=1 Tax=Pomacea canaliculata TaxID=400727 RepID=UPI000D72E304|nr:uncharacterized protein LOC112577226 [Pomacea canaliculata]